jgi:hypothetical protein
MSLKEYSLKTRLAGWRCSADRTRLHYISLRTGNFTGNLAILELPNTVSELEITVPQRVFKKFPTQTNRDNISGNREF